MKEKKTSMAFGITEDGARRISPEEFGEDDGALAINIDENTSVLELIEEHGAHFIVSMFSKSAMEMLDPETQKNWAVIDVEATKEEGDGGISIMKPGQVSVLPVSVAYANVIGASLYNSVVEDLGSGIFATNAQRALLRREIDKIRMIGEDMTPEIASELADSLQEILDLSMKDGGSLEDFNEHNGNQWEFPKTDGELIAHYMKMHSGSCEHEKG